MSSHDHKTDWNAMYAGDAHACSDPDPLLLEMIEGLEPGRALDIGCGVGGLVIELAERGWEVTGIDIASNAIAAGEKLLESKGLSAHLHTADATTWKPESSYDLVISSFALPETREGQDKVFRMAQEALAPGGRLLLKDFDPGMKERHEAFAHFHHPSIEELRAAFAGLQILRAEVVETPTHHHGGHEGEAAEAWTAAFVHAQRSSS